MKLYILTFICFAFLNVQSQIDTINQYESNKKIGFWIEDEQHSEIMEVQIFYKGKGYYKNGFKTGLWDYFDQSGLKVFSIGFDNGFKDSVITYHLNGNINKVTKSEKENHYIIYSFYESGKPLDTIIKLDTITKYIEYWENGGIKQKGLATGSRGIFYTYYESGKISGISKTCCGYIEGLITEYYESGLIKSEKNYKKGKLQGTVLLYYQNGNLKEKSTYNNNVKHGKCYYYNDKGIVIEVKTFDNGVEKNVGDFPDHK